MRIRKISQSAAIPGKIVNSPSDSTTETYSCDYINDVSVVVSPTEPVGVNRKKVWLQKGKNLLKITLSSETLNGITFTNSNDGTIKANGTASAEAGAVAGWLDLTANKTYTISGNADDGTNYKLLVQFYQDDTYVSGVEVNDTHTFTYEGTENYNRLRIRTTVKLGVTASNILFKPQIEIGTTASPFEYVEEKMYVKNDNNVYEEFMKKEDTTYLLDTYKASGIELYEGSNAVVHNNLVILKMNFGGTFAANTNVTIATLPEKLRPNSVAAGSCTFHKNRKNMEVGVVVIFTDGHIEVSSTTTQTQCMLTLTYSLN